MNIALILERAAAAAPDRIGLVCQERSWRYGDLLDAARGAFELIQESEAEAVAILDDCSEASVFALFGAALAGVPYCPLDSTLADEVLGAELQRLAPAIVIGDEERATRIAGTQGHMIFSREDFSLKAQETVPDDNAREYDPGGGVAIEIFTRDTRDSPRAEIFRHSQLLDQLAKAASAPRSERSDVILLAVPPHNIVGILALLFAVQECRKAVLLPYIAAEAWFTLVESQRVSQALVVPALLACIVEDMEAGVGRDLTTLRAIACAGAEMPLEVMRRALELFPEADFTSAWGPEGVADTITVLAHERPQHALADVAAILGAQVPPARSIDF
ncbi:AMP-binding protein [Novosphingobium pentaromativorans]|uniref:AMP-dependent synthetase and ligase n=1 Tax=Novosphingobium pentaromativorans US6-1 TaxID=1088721 RepID=G6EI79_9SPHN|nr:class I adenylate-forming enzyme family protein [Novosphingobium pentaromativorans]EHJ58821.1 AMP-dependent synthetase and ligase [Novosphingobium pentaromativorans US6-1]